MGDEHDVSPHLERLLKQHGDKLPKTKRILEINPEHSILKKMLDRFSKDKNDPLLADYAFLLYDYGLLTEGAAVSNPVKFTALLAQLMDKAI